MGEGNSSAPLFQITGNIKQQFNPFVLKPNAAINALSASTSRNLENASPQFFTYKNGDLSKHAGGATKLNFYPSSLDSIQFKEDISYKLLYARSYKTPESSLSQSSITISDILNAIPGIQIREFLPDTRLDQCINFYKDLVENMADVFKKDEGSDTADKNKEKKNSISELMGKILTVSQYTIKYMVGVSKPNFYDDLSLANLLKFSSYRDAIVKGDAGKYVMTFPYILYYKLQSCVTTNIYEIPAVQAEKRIITSDGGMAGWIDGGDDLMSAGGFRLSNLIGKIPAIGSIANMILGNIGVNYMPWWNAASGAKTKEPEISITFDLFNDTIDAAISNFLFINTIVPNNKWIQYNMFQHSSSLYDIKIEGINRLYACAGSFGVTYEGVLRDPPPTFYKNIMTYMNNAMDKTEFYSNLFKNKIVKIPDVYRVSMKFQSLLPANFNNYIFNYAENANHITKYEKTSYESSILAKALPNAIGSYIKRVGAVWNTGKEEAAATAVKQQQK